MIGLELVRGDFLLVKPPFRAISSECTANCDVSFSDRFNEMTGK